MRFNRAVKSKIGRPTKPYVTIICRFCGKSFDVRPCDSNQRKYCSRICQVDSKRKVFLTKSQLEKWYVDDKLSTTQISRRLDGKIGDWQVGNYLRRYGIQLRTVGQGVTLAQTGIKHTAEWNSNIGKANKGKRRDEKFRDNVSKRMKAMSQELSNRFSGKNNPVFKNKDFIRTGRVRFKQGRSEDLGDTWYRSSWERNYARYLNWLISINEIVKWEYEPDTFYFEKIRRGTRSYTPDFKIWEKDNSIIYHEVKGREVPKDRTKWKRMALYHPNVKIIVVDAQQYRALAKQMKPLLENWE